MVFLFLFVRLVDWFFIEFDFNEEKFHVFIWVMFIFLVKIEHSNSSEAIRRFEFNWAKAEMGTYLKNFGRYLLLIEKDCFFGRNQMISQLKTKKINFLRQ